MGQGDGLGEGGDCRWPLIWGLRWYPRPSPGSPIGVGDDGCGGTVRVSRFARPRLPHHGYRIGVRYDGEEVRAGIHVRLATIPPPWVPHRGAVRRCGVSGTTVCAGRVEATPGFIPELLRLTVSPLSALLPGWSREAIYLGSWFSSCPSARCDNSTVVSATTPPTLGG